MKKSIRCFKFKKQQKKYISRRRNVETNSSRVSKKIRFKLKFCNIIDNDNIFYNSNDGREKVAVFDGNKLNSASYLQEMKLALGLIKGFPKELTNMI